MATKLGEDSSVLIAEGDLADLLCEVCPSWYHSPNIVLCFYLGFVTQDFDAAGTAVVSSQCAFFPLLLLSFSVLFTFLTDPFHCRYSRLSKERCKSYG